MARVIAIEHLTLDGVMQGPAGADEDPRGGFELGGWAATGTDGRVVKAIGEAMGAERRFLFGRRTYAQFASVWPYRTGDPMADALTRTRKYVVSRTLTAPLAWENSVLLAGEATDVVAPVRARDPGTLVIFGSGELTRALLAAGLLDLMLLIVHPIVLGRGRRLFAAGPPASMALRDTTVSETGVIAARYELAARDEAPTD